MADAAVTFLLENLSELIARQADLLTDAEEDISWIQTELRLMVPFFQSIDHLHQLPETAIILLDQTRKVIRETEDVIQTYVKWKSQLLRASIFLRPIRSFKLRNLHEKLWDMRDQIIQVRQGWKSVDFAANSRHLHGSSSRHWGLAAMDKLDSALQVGDLDPGVLECIKWVRNELVPLHDFLQEVDDIQVSGERQKIWIQELRGIFQFIDESFAEEKGAKKWQSISLIIGIPNFHKINLRKVVSEIQGKIVQLYRRNYAYGFGEILVNDDSRAIFPRIRMTTPIPAVSMSDDLPIRLDSCIACTLRRMFSSSVQPSQRTMTYLSVLRPEASIELLRVDLRLMKALLEDTRSMEDLDERAKVWLNQVQEISADLEGLDEYVSDVSRGRKGAFHQLFGRVKMIRKLRQIANEIHDIAARKMTYGIGGALGEAGMLLSIDAILAINEPHRISVNFLNQSVLEIVKKAFISKAKVRRRVEPIRKELQLLQALFEDVNRMEKLDAGLKVWVEEMLGIAHEANDVLKLDYRSFGTRYQALDRIKHLYYRILMMSKWKHTYNIGDVKSSCTGVFNHNLAETAPYPSNAIKKEPELNRRQIKLIQTLYGDTEEMVDKLGGTAKAWMEEMRNLIRDATELISRKTNYISVILDLGENRKMVNRMMDKMSQLSEIKIAYGIERRRLPPSVVCEMKEKLLVDQEHSCIIPILGMRHMHKEALQELINNDNAIKHHFDGHTWVYVPEGFRVASIFESIMRQIMEQQKAKFHDVELASKLEAPTEEVLMQMLQETLMHKRYLIVLDEVQSIEVWQHLERVFPKRSTQSRIILISNEHTYSFLNSSSMATSDPVKLGELPSEPRDMMPGSDAFDINNVPSYLRQCLYYFLLFPANFEVPTRRLVVLWVAEGLVRRNEHEHEHESDEDVANDCLKKLIELNFVHGKMKKLNGNYKACQLNEGIRDTLSMKAKESRFFQDTPEKLSRLVDHHGTSDSCFIHIHGNPKATSSVKNYLDVLSFMSFDTREGNKPGEDIGKFLHKCISAGCFLELRVLDLEKVFRPKLSEAICGLMLLKYLGLRWTYLEHLPKYMNKLLNLQVLDVKHTYISLLPRSIWSMQYLRHLYLSETYRTKFVGNPSDVSLKELQTLWGAFIDENTCVINGLDKSLNIRKLGLSCRPSSSSSQLSDMSEQLKAVNKWISKLAHLKVLRLKSRDEKGEASELHLEPLTNEELSTVYLLGKLKPSVVSEFPVNLIDITLSGSELNVDPMIFLEKLQQLRILRLLSQSVVFTSMRCSKGGFPQLRVLKIWKLKDLKEWEVEEGALVSLEELEIRSCMNLKMLPDALQHVNTLQECMLTSMPEEFIDKTQISLPKLWPKIKLDA